MGRILTSQFMFLLKLCYSYNPGNKLVDFLNFQTLSPPPLYNVGI